MSYSLDQKSVLSENYEIADIQNMINMMYNLVLNRNADIHGLTSYTDLIIKEGTLKGYIKVLDSLINSEEYKILLSNTYKNELKDTFYIKSNKIDEKPIQHIVSLGTHCLSSYFLKFFGLKTYSLPFDWLFTSPEMIIDCISNNFDFFLKQEFFLQ